MIDNLFIRSHYDKLSSTFIELLNPFADDLFACPNSVGFVIAKSSFTFRSCKSGLHTKFCRQRNKVNSIYRIQ